MPPPEQLALARDAVALERTKLDLEAKAREASAEQDKRIAAFHTRRLERDDVADQRRVKLATRTLIAIFAVVAGPLALLLGMAFSGNETPTMLR